MKLVNIEKKRSKSVTEIEIGIGPKKVAAKKRPTYLYIGYIYTAVGRKPLIMTMMMRYFTPN